MARFLLVRPVARTTSETDKRMQLKKTLGLALLSGAIALGTAVPAQAALYLPTLDPAYGAAFPSLGWRATGLLYVPDACEAAIGLGAFALTSFGPQPDASCASAQLQGVTVEFYDTAAPLVTRCGVNG